MIFFIAFISLPFVCFYHSPTPFVEWYHTICGKAAEKMHLNGEKTQKEWNPGNIKKIWQPQSYIRSFLVNWSSWVRILRYIEPLLSSTSKFWVQDQILYKKKGTKLQQQQKISLAPFLSPVLPIGKTISIHNFRKLEALPAEPAVLKLIMRCVILVHLNRTFWNSIFNQKCMGIKNLYRTF